jgi:hypothetical protein
MSSYSETTQASYRDAAGRPTRQRWQILVGVSVAVILAVATVTLVNESDPPVVEQPLQPVAQSYASADDLATRPELLAQSLARVDDLATRSELPARDYASYDGDLLQVVSRGAVGLSTTPPRSNALSAIEARGVAFADEWPISGYYGQPEAGSLTEAHVPMANNQMR